MSSVRASYIRSDTALLVRDYYRPIVAGGRWLIATHGYNGTHQTWGANSGNKLPFVKTFLDAGFVILSSDAGGTQNWGGPANQTEITNVYNIGLSMGLSSRCDLLAASMGGLGALNWMKNNASKVRSCLLFCPTTDLDAAHNDAGFTASIEAIYPNYAVDSANYDPIDNVASFIGLGIPTRIYHDTADTVVPVQTARDFVAAAGSGYELIETGGAHTTLFDYISSAEAVRWVAAQT